MIRWPGELQSLIRDFTPSVAAFHEYKQELLAMDGQADPSPLVGFKKLAVHRLSYSGLGTMSGGPLGGWSQAGKDKIDSRWRPDRLIREVSDLHTLLQACRPYHEQCTADDFAHLLRCNAHAALS